MIILLDFTFLEKNFFRDYIDMLPDANYDAKQTETKGKGLQTLTPKEMLQKLAIALA